MKRSILSKGKSSPTNSTTTTTTSRRKSTTTTTKTSPVKATRARKATSTSILSSTTAVDNTLPLDIVTTTPKTRSKTQKESEISEDSPKEQKKAPKVHRPYTTQFNSMIDLDAIDSSPTTTTTTTTTTPRKASKRSTKNTQMSDGEDPDEMIGGVLASTLKEFVASRPPILRSDRSPALPFSDIVMRPMFNSIVNDKQKNGVITAGKRVPWMQNIALIEGFFQCNPGQYSEGDKMLSTSSTDLRTTVQNSISRFIALNGGQGILPEQKFGAEYDKLISSTSVVTSGTKGKNEKKGKKMGDDEDLETTTTTSTTIVPTPSKKTKIQRIVETLSIETRIQDIPIADIEDLTSDPYNGIRSAGFETLVLMYNHKETTPEQKRSIAHWYLRSGSRTKNWNVVDISAYKIIGRYLVDNPSERNVLMELTEKGDFWEQRVGVVSTLALIKAGHFKEIIDIADWHLLPQVPAGEVPVGVVGKNNDSDQNNVATSTTKTTTTTTTAVTKKINKKQQQSQIKQEQSDLDNIDYSKYPISTARSSILNYEHNHLMHKAIGWMLREMGKMDKNVLDSWLLKGNRFLILPTHTYSYCLEKHTPEERSVYARKKRGDGFIPVHDQAM